MKKIAIIGGGFYGTNLSLELDKMLVGTKNVEIHILDKNMILSGAIMNNQHRLHLGYHYPRSLETIRQTINSYDKFIANYSDCVISPKKNYYLISSKSKVKYKEYIDIFSSFSLIHKEVPKNLLRTLLNNPEDIDGVIDTQEKTICLSKVKNKILDSLSRSEKIKIVENTEVVRVEGTTLTLKTDDVNKYKCMEYDIVINCSYNQPFLGISKDKIPQNDTKHELCFIPVYRDVEGFFNNSCYTIMDGDFCSIYQTGDSNQLTISSVLYTPFYKSNRVEDIIEKYNNISSKEIRDVRDNIETHASKHFKLLNKLEYVNMYISIKTKNKNDHGDIRNCYYIKEGNRFYVMSGKISSFYDIKDKILSDLKEII